MKVEGAVCFGLGVFMDRNGKRACEEHDNNFGYGHTAIVFVVPIRGVSSKRQAIHHNACKQLTSNGHCS